MAARHELIQLESGWRTITGEVNRLVAFLSTDFDESKRPFTSKETLANFDVVHRMCNQRPPHNFTEQLYNRHNEMYKGHLTTVYNRVKGLTGLELLRTLEKVWADQVLMTRWTTKFFAYLNRFHVEHHNLPRVDMAAMNVFRDVVFEPLKSHISGAVVALVNEERDGGLIDRAIVKRVAEMFQTMGSGTLEVYDRDFQRPFIAATRTYYQAKAAAWMAAETVPSYLAKVEGALTAETERVMAYLLPSTEPPLLGSVQDVLLRQHSSTLLENPTSGLRVMLAEDKRGDLARVYRIFSRVGASFQTGSAASAAAAAAIGPAGLEPIARILREYIQDQGLAIVNTRGAAAAGGAAAGGAGGAAGGPAPREELGDPAFVVPLLDLHDRVRALVTNEFSGASMCQKALKEAFEIIVNKTVPNVRFTNAAMIAGYADRVLRTGGLAGAGKLSEEEIDAALDRIVAIFAYIADKDVFGEEYRLLLSKRLLYERSASSDAERGMISKLKLRCGAQYTSKMEGMMNDLAAANESVERFKDHVSASRIDIPGGMDFSCQVLTSGWWPSFPTVALTLPASLQRCQEVFTQYYTAKFDHRKLTWVHALGNGNVRATFGTQVYDFGVATLQMVVLMHFNSVAAGTQVGFEDLARAVGADVDVLKRTLHSLSCAKYKVLTKTPESNSIGTSDRFAVNDRFASPVRKIRIPMPTLEEKNATVNVEEDRNASIEAAVVRIMKSRKTLPHQELVMEVCEQLKFFRPNARTVKKRIEHLIEREYLERDTADQNLYKYVA